MSDSESLEEFMLADPHRGSWLVYINGIEIPCPSVSVTYGPWMMPELSLSFAPHSTLERLGAEDRVEVVVFFLDDIQDPANPVYRLLGDGEILGWGYTSSAAGRRITFSVIADISMFQQLFFYFMNTVDAAAAAALQPEAGRVTTTGVAYPFSLFKRGLNLKPDDPDIQVPYDLVYNMVRGLVGSEVPPEKRTIPGVNFFSRWARKRNFVNRFSALPLFEEGTDENVGLFPLFKAVQGQFAVETMRDDLAKTVGDAGSMWDVLKQLFGVAFFELCMLPTASPVRVRNADGVILGAPEEASAEPTSSRLLNYFAKPQLLFGVAPMCNVVFPSMASSLTYQENYWQQPTRTYVNDSFIEGQLGASDSTAAALRVGFPPEIDAAMHKSFQQSNASFSAVDNAVKLANGKNVLVFPEEFYKGPVSNRMRLPQWFYLLQKQAKKVDADVAAANPLSSNLSEHDKLLKLFELYAQYEHFRARYEKRGGAVDLAFNPYLVPGFPCVIFDNRSGGFNCVGYLATVRHELSIAGQGSMRTSINYGFGRTMREFFDLWKTTMETVGYTTAAAPLEPIDQVRDIIQDKDSAEEFYRALFHQRASDVGRPASAYLPDIVGFKEDPTQNEVTRITVEGTPAKGNVKYLVQDGVNLPAPPKLTFPGSSVIVPVDEAMNTRFHNYDAAMRYVARPICTIDEYVRFIHGGEPPAGEVEFEETSRGVTIYKRIKRMRYNPASVASAQNIGLEPPVQPPGAQNAQAAQAAPLAVSPEAVPVDFSQTRADWETALLEYRNVILSQEYPLS